MSLHRYVHHDSAQLTSHPICAADYPLRLGHRIPYQLSDTCRNNLFQCIPVLLWPCWRIRHRTHSCDGDAGRRQSCSSTGYNNKRAASNRHPHLANSCRNCRRRSCEFFTSCCWFSLALDVGGTRLLAVRNVAYWSEHPLREPSSLTVCFVTGRRLQWRSIAWPNAERPIWSQ